MISDIKIYFLRCPWPVSEIWKFVLCNILSSFLEWERYLWVSMLDSQNWFFSSMVSYSLHFLTTPSSSVQVAIANDHWPVASTTNIYFAQFWSLGSLRSRCWHRWCLLRALFGLQMVAFATYLTRWCTERDRHLVFPPFKIYHEAPTLMTWSIPNHLPKALSPNTITGGLRFQHMNLTVGDTNIYSILHSLSGTPYSWPPSYLTYIMIIAS